MKLITVDQIMKWQPCEDYPRERVEELVGAGKTALEILELNIPHKDCLWVVLREEVIDAKILRLFVADCAERALLREREQGREPDKRSWKAVEAARKYAHGKITETKLQEAYVNARYAARDAAWYAARYAARAAASAAANAAAWYAADDAARYAAGGAARAAAWDARAAANAAATYTARAADDARDAERKWQVQRLKELIQ